jgi:hypothetical protein
MFNLINNTVDNCITLLLHENKNYFNELINKDDDYFKLSFDESIINDIKSIVIKKCNDDTNSIYKIIRDTLDYILYNSDNDNHYMFYNRFKYQVFNLK